MGKHSWKNWRISKPKDLKGLYDIVIETNDKKPITVVVRDCKLSNKEFIQIDTKETFSVFDTIEYRLQE